MSNIEPQIRLGFAEEIEDRRWLLRHRFPSKLGGRPAWLHPAALPHGASLEFEESEGRKIPLLFLLQLYAPPSSNFAHEDAFHRSIFLFVSAEGGDLSQCSGQVKAFRCQLPRENPWYPDHPAEDLPFDAEPPELQEDELKWVTSIDPWQVSQWEQTVDDSKYKTTRELFKEYELVVDVEDVDDTAAGTSENAQHAQRLLEQYNNSEMRDAEIPEDVLNAVENQATPEQRQFAEFQAALGNAADQVIRYAFNSHVQPLWPNTSSTPEHIPPCPLCNGPRVFEFQVLPQAINFLGKAADDPSAPDWGTIVVYSCQQSCNLSPNTAKNCSQYVEEFVFVQSPS